MRAAGSDDCTLDRCAEADRDVRGLPDHGFGARSLMWWGTVGLMVVEGTVFALAVAMYAYLRDVAPVWPPAVPPDPGWGVLNVAVLLASLLPNHFAKAAAEAGDRWRAARWLGACLATAIAFLAIRALEFTSLNVRWYESAYGSIVWLLLGLHTTHLITDTIDTAVLVALLFTGPFEPKRLVDVSENALYWVFVVVSWLPIHAVIYWMPRP